MIHLGVNLHLNLNVTGHKGNSLKGEGTFDDRSCQLLALNGRMEEKDV